MSKRAVVEMPAPVLEIAPRELPTLYTVLEWENGAPTKMARCHLDYKGGSVYLQWREGKKSRSFYLGRAPRKSPATPEAES